MSSSPNPFVWYELMTRDAAAASAFYAKVLGWSAADAGMSGASYTIVSAGATAVAGIMPIPEEARAMGAQPVWMGYVGVDDVDAVAQRVATAGGAIHRPPADIPGVGRFAVVADPHGAGFMLFKGMGAQQAPAPAAPDTPGHVGWRELHAGDGVAAFGFYAGLFGWTKGDAMDMGEHGVYQLFAAGGPPIGGMMTKMPQTPVPFWLYYFNVEAVDAAVNRATGAGAQVVNGPMEVPGGSWIVQCVDPQGAMFALVGPKR